MIQFQLYNFQFGKVADGGEKKLFGDTDPVMSAEEAFPRKQELLRGLLEDDYTGARKIRFSHRKYRKEYTHKHLMRPTDDIAVMRIANRRTARRTDRNFKVVDEEDYPNCIVIIDNRPGIQRLAIEAKKSVFASDTMPAEIIEHTLNALLRKYSLNICLMHLHDAEKFWSIVDDRRTYPAGFYKVKFHLPYLNLERLRKKWNGLTVQMRDSYQARMDVEMTAQKVGELKFSKDDARQAAQISFLAEELGGDSIELVPNNNKRKTIKVGQGSYKIAWISDATFDRLKDDAEGGDLFGGKALDTIKREMKKGID